MFFVTFTLFTGGILQGQEPWTLETLKAALLEKNLELLSQKEAVKGLNSLAFKKTLDVMNPKIGANFMDLDPAAPLDFAKAPLRISISQEIPNPFKLEAQGRAASAKALSQEMNLKAMEDQKILDLEKTYYNFSALTEILKNKKFERKLLERVINASRVQYQNGKLSFSQLTALEISLSELDLDLLDQENQLNRYKLDIKNLITHSQKTFNLEPMTLVPPEKGWPELGESKVLNLYQNTSPQRSMALQEIQEAAGDQNTETVNSFPSFGLMAEGVYNPADSSTKISLGLEVSLPLWGIPGELAQNNAAAAEVQRRTLALQNLDFTRERQIEALVFGLKQDLASLDILQKRVMKSADENLLHMTREYEVQGVDLQTLVETLVSTFELKNRYFLLLSKVYTAHSELKALTGAKNIF